MAGVSDAASVLVLERDVAQALGWSPPCNRCLGNIINLLVPSVPLSEGFIADTGFCDGNSCSIYASSSSPATGQWQRQHGHSSTYVRFEVGALATFRPDSHLNKLVSRGLCIPYCRVCYLFVQSCYMWDGALAIKIFGSDPMLSSWPAAYGRRHEHGQTFLHVVYTDRTFPMARSGLVPPHHCAQMM